jgi:cysteine desulfurase
VTAAPAGFLDAASGLPLHPAAREALAAALEDGWADPARPHHRGRRSALLLDAAREAMAAELAVAADELSFTSSGALAAHLAVLGTGAARRRQGSVVVHSAVEHSAVLQAVDWHTRQGGAATSVGVDPSGRVDVEEFVSAAGAGASAAVLQAANHEVATVQPVGDVAERLGALGVPLVVDASHSLVFGTAPAAAAVFFADARLWGGPAGVGVLVVRRGTRWRPPFPSGEAERGRSATTPDVPAVVAAAAAFRATRADRATEAARLSGLVDLLRAEVPARVPDTVVLGHPTERLPHIATFCCLGMDGEPLLAELDRAGFSVSSGSSCTADTRTASHVLVAMNAPSSGNIRVSLPPDTAESEVRRFVDTLAAAVATVRGQLPGGPAGGSVLDSRGRRCPLPVLDLARAVAAAPVGSGITLLADDPAAAADVAAWCRMRGQELLASERIGAGGWSFAVRRVR